MTVSSNGTVDVLFAEYILGFVVVVMENTNKATALANPYYQKLADEGVLLNGYQGEHASNFLGITRADLIRHQPPLAA